MVPSINFLDDKSKHTTKQKRARVQTETVLAGKSEGRLSAVFFLLLNPSHALEIGPHIGDLIHPLFKAAILPRLVAAKLVEERHHHQRSGEVIPEKLEQRTTNQGEIVTPCFGGSLDGVKIENIPFQIVLIWLDDVITRFFTDANFAMKACW